MKLKKKSGLMGAIIALSCASLVSVGFASWVISQGDSKTVDGSIQVDTVKDDRHLLTVTPTTGATIVFAAPAGASAGAWLRSDNAKTEQLEAEFTITVTNVAADADESILGFSLKSGTIDGNVFTEDASNAGYKKAYSEGLVADLPSPVYSNTSVTNNVLTTTLTLTFDWGDDFDNNNPYDYYNAQTYTSDLGDEALAQLELLEDCLTGISYRMVISVDSTVPGAEA